MALNTYQWQCWDPSLPSSFPPLVRCLSSPQALPVKHWYYTLLSPALLPPSQAGTASLTTLLPMPPPFFTKRKSTSVPDTVRNGGMWPFRKSLWAQSLAEPQLLRGKRQLPWACYSIHHMSTLTRLSLHSLLCFIILRGYSTSSWKMDIIKKKLYMFSNFLHWNKFIF